MLGWATRRGTKTYAATRFCCWGFAPTTVINRRGPAAPGVAAASGLQGSAAFASKWIRIFPTTSGSSSPSLTSTRTGTCCAGYECWKTSRKRTRTEEDEEAEQAGNGPDPADRAYASRQRIGNPTAFTGSLHPWGACQVPRGSPFGTSAAACAAEIGPPVGWRDGFSGRLWGVFVESGQRRGQKLCGAALPGHQLVVLVLRRAALSRRAGIAVSPCRR